MHFDNNEYEYAHYNRKIAVPKVMPTISTQISSDI